MTSLFRTLRPWVRVLIFGTVVVWIASLWNPFYLAPLGQTAPFAEVVAGRVSVAGDSVGPVLSDGTSLTQQVYLDDVAVFPHAGVQRIACVRVPFVTFQRSNVGEVRVELSAGMATREFTLDASQVDDWQVLPFCLELDDSNLGGKISVTLSGFGAGTGEAVAPLLGVFGGGGRPTLFPAEIRTGFEQILPRSAEGPLALEYEVIDFLTRPAQTASIFRSPERALVLGLPMLLAVLVVVLLALQIVPLQDDEARIGGVGLGIAGVIVLMVGLEPAAVDRDLLPLRPAAQNISSYSTLALAAEQRIVQVLPTAGMLPLELGRDGRGQRERFCIGIPIVDVRPDGRLAGTLDIAITFGDAFATGGSSRRREVSRIVDLREAVGGPLVTCFRISSHWFRNSEPVELSLALSGDSDSESIALETRPRRNGEATVVIAGSRVVTLPQAIDAQLLREVPSYRESVFARIGHAALATSMLLLVRSALFEVRFKVSGRRRPSRRSPATGDGC